MRWCCPPSTTGSLPITTCATAGWSDHQAVLPARAAAQGHPVPHQPDRQLRDRRPGRRLRPDRKIIDSYGGMARHGGGAFSGKDPSKVDRSAAYAGRYVAKNIVAAGLAERCEIQVSYAIGVAQPTSISINTFGTGKVSDEKIVQLVREHFDLRPRSPRCSTCLHLYQPTAAYGHFGRSSVELTVDGDTFTAFTWGEDRQGRSPARRRRPLSDRAIKKARFGGAFFRQAQRMRSSWWNSRSGMPCRRRSRRRLSASPCGPQNQTARPASLGALQHAQLRRLRLALLVAIADVRGHAE